MRDFKKLEIWNRSIKLVSKIYLITNQLPKTEQFSLASQINRSAISIPSNIAEGCSRESEKDFRRFLEIALGSSFELETQLIIIVDLFSSINKQDVENCINEVIEIQKMIRSFTSKLKI